MSRRRHAMPNRRLTCNRRTDDGGGTKNAPSNVQGSSVLCPLSSVLRPPMPATPDDLFAFLDRLGIAHPTVTHAPVFTVEEARALRGEVPGAHTKNLFLKDKKDALYLVVALEDAAIELKSLHRLIGASGRSRSAPPSSLARRSASSPAPSPRSRPSTTPAARCARC